MTTLAVHHHHYAHAPSTPLRLMDFVVLALVAIALGFVAQSDNPPVLDNSVYSPAR